MANEVSHVVTASVFETIENRLANLTPPVVLKDHIETDPSIIGPKEQQPNQCFYCGVTGVRPDLHVHANTLDGIRFVVRDRDNLETALRKAKDNLGKKAFIEGRKLDPKHWALGLSFMATDGIGFREKWRYQLTNRSRLQYEARPIGLNIAKLDGKFAGQFGGNIDLPDRTALHCSVWRAVTKNGKQTICNIHIDESGITMVGPDGNVSIHTDTAQHTVNELLWKTEMRGRVPDWLVDRTNIILPNSSNDYGRAGISFDVVQEDNYRIAVTGSCSVYGRFDCSGTVNAIGSHGLLDGSQ